MALPNGLVFEVRTTANDNNSGAFNSLGATPGTDRTLQDSPHVTIDGVTVSATVHTTTSQINITGFTVSSADIRNTLRITGGTATAGLYEITAVDTVNNRWTVDRAAGTSTQTVQGRMGGALASPALAASFVTSVAAAKIWVKSGTYTMSTTSNVSGGRVTFSGAGAGRSEMESYQTTRGDRAARAVFQPSANSTTLVTSNFGLCTFRGIEADANGKTSCTGFTGGANDSFEDCIARSCATGFSNTTCYQTQAISCTTGYSSCTNTYTFASGATTGYSNSSVCLFSVASGCTTGFTSSGTPIYIGNVAYNSTTVAFGATAAAGTLINNIAYNASGTLTTAFSVTRNTRMLNNAYGGTITTVYSQNGNFLENNVGTIVLSGNPFTNAGSGDFSLNNTAGAGALLRATGAPTTTPWGAGTQSLDIGSLQVAGSGAAAASTFNTVIGSAGLAH